MHMRPREKGSKTGQISSDLPEMPRTLSEASSHAFSCLPQRLRRLALTGWRWSGGICLVVACSHPTIPHIAAVITPADLIPWACHRHALTGKWPEWLKFGVLVPANLIRFAHYLTHMQAGNHRHKTAIRLHVQDFYANVWAPAIADDENAKLLSRTIAGCF
jgi:hypothetical protein